MSPAALAFFHSALWLAERIAYEQRRLMLLANARLSGRQRP